MPLAGSAQPGLAQRASEISGPSTRRFFENLFGERKDEPIKDEEDDGPVLEVHSEEELDRLVAMGDEIVVKLSFTWCRPCKGFWPKYQKYAQVYSNTRFVRIVGNENDSCKHYAQAVLEAKISPMFASYSNGQLVKTWTGANTGRFIENIEESLTTARDLQSVREAAVLQDTTLAPT